MALPPDVTALPSDVTALPCRRSRLQDIGLCPSFGPCPQWAKGRTRGTAQFASHSFTTRQSLVSHPAAEPLHPTAEPQQELWLRVLKMQGRGAP